MNLTEQQHAAVSHLREWKVGALFMEPGTGKTRAALELIRAVGADMVLWLGPLRTLGDVRRELDRWGGIDNLVMVGVESISASDRIYLETRSVIRGRCFCVVDESLKIKNAEAKRTRHIIELGQLCEYRLVLNGTPLSRNLLDLWAQMQFLSPRILSMTLAQFKNTFCRYTTVTKRMGFHQYTKEFITGYENVDYLYSLIRHYVYQCDLSLRISQMYEDVPYTLTTEEREEYERLKEKYLDDEMLQWKRNNIFLEMTSKMQHSYCTAPSKLSALASLMERIPQEQTIIFCRFIQSREMLTKLYPRAKVLSYQKEAFGLNLQECCHTVYFDKVWDYALRIQSSRRTFRTGQEHDCHYYDLTGNVGLESLIDRNINKKIGMTEYFKRATIEDLKRDL